MCGRYALPQFKRMCMRRGKFLPVYYARKVKRKIKEVLAMQIHEDDLSEYSQAPQSTPFWHN